MKKLSVLLGLFFVLAIAPSCNKFGMNKDIVQEMQVFIDMTLHNKYNPSRFIGGWTLKKVTLEVYEDGNLITSEDHIKDVYFPNFYIYEDGSLKQIGVDGLGRWAYAHNFLFWKLPSNSFTSEVVNVTSSTLVFRMELLSIGGEVVTFYQDKSGEHSFFVYEFSKLKKY